MVTIVTRDHSTNNEAKGIYRGDDGATIRFSRSSQREDRARGRTIASVLEVEYRSPDGKSFQMQLQGGYIFSISGEAVDIGSLHAEMQSLDQRLAQFDRKSGTFVLNDSVFKSLDSAARRYLQNLGKDRGKITNTAIAAADDETPRYDASLPKNNKRVSTIDFV